MMLDFFRTNRKRLEKIEQQQSRKRREIERNVCALVARGNISLQRGEYITKEDLDQAQAKLEAFFFSDKSKW
ncbi:MAG: hypothetical protein LBI05_01270 [Planctomycetaceae bacterium]|jgi:hypothetical protein|nr:hypothetical protein [Planctomycetaceae bacterium]